METWKDIPGCEGQYQISNYGNARRLAFIKSFKNHYGTVTNRKYKAKNVKTFLSLGYPELKIHSRHLKIHRLVALLFIDNPYNKPHVNHIDGTRCNNHVSNLEWCTASENMQHAWDNGLNKSTSAQRFAACKTGKSNSKMVVNLETGIYYDSAIEAAQSMCIKLRTFQSWMAGHHPNRSSFIYV